MPPFKVPGKHGWRSQSKALLGDFPAGQPWPPVCGDRCSLLFSVSGRGGQGRWPEKPTSLLQAHTLPPRSTSASHPLLMLCHLPASVCAVNKLLSDHKGRFSATLLLSRPGRK